MLILLKRLTWFTASSEDAAVPAAAETVSVGQEATQAVFVVATRSKIINPRLNIRSAVFSSYPVQSPASADRWAAWPPHEEPGPPFP